MSNHNKQNQTLETDDRREARKRIDDLMDWIIWGDKTPFGKTLPEDNEKF